jgi:hypothetical protein
MRSTERLICLLESVNADAVNNDDGKPGEFLAEVCHEAAARLKELAHAEVVNRMRLESLQDMVSEYEAGDHGC